LSSRDNNFDDRYVDSHYASGRFAFDKEIYSPQRRNVRNKDTEEFHVTMNRAASEYMWTFKQVVLKIIVGIFTFGLNKIIK
jgi:hypothetical protein